jgi:hypothetical protein
VSIEKQYVIGRSPATAVVNYKERLRGKERVDDFVVACAMGCGVFIMGGEGGYDRAWFLGVRGMSGRRLKKSNHPG